MKSKKLQYRVIFESSVIYGKPIRKEVIDLVKNYNGLDNLEIQFYAPELVLEESRKHLLDDFEETKLKHDSAIKELKTYLKSKKIKPINRSEKEIFDLVTSAYKANKINILNTPYSKIDWEDLIKKAVFKKSPFSGGEKEKGFKDAIIAETIIKNLPELSKDSIVAVLVEDDLLAEYLKEKSEKINNIKFFSSVPDFESALRLHMLKNDDKLIDEINKEADTIFYTPLGKDSLFYKEDMPQKIFTKYPTLFANPEIEDNKYYGFGWVSNEKNWIPVTEPEYRVSKPVFIKNDGMDYYWSSSVIYRQLFENKPKNATVSFGFDMRGEWKLEFKIEWKTTIDEKGNIMQNSAKTTNIVYMPRSLARGIAESYAIGNIGTMASGATLAGQGTIPVATLSPSPSASFSPSASMSPSASPSPSEEAPEDNESGA